MGGGWCKCFEQGIFGVCHNFQDMIHAGWWLWPHMVDLSRCIWNVATLRRMQLGGSPFGHIAREGSPLLMWFLRTADANHPLHHSMTTSLWALPSLWWTRLLGFTAWPLADVGSFMTLSDDPASDAGALGSHRVFRTPPGPWPAGGMNVESWPRAEPMLPCCPTPYPLCRVSAANILLCDIKRPCFEFAGHYAMSLWCYCQPLGVTQPLAHTWPLGIPQPPVNFVLWPASGHCPASGGFWPLGSPQPPCRD